ncbi:DsbE family thiol:disulfide interchange protein [Asaia sp. W19]|uniref:redoxin domain-containing protein n=1 Tax=unclassified Asaia TaxID=2685023 RepID=UPI000F8CDBB8|nr:redoxin domain-containing protein [Asaia sp. W19]RUT25329.1 DsbE family thiol:disulfide interchange protein [Asaia sp. W19]
MSVPTRRRLLMALPVAGAGLVGAGCWKMLASMQTGQFDPRAIRLDSQARLVPDFALAGLSDREPGFDAAALKASPVPVLINFFASWCIPCVTEMAALRVIGRQIPIWGIAYKDRPEDTERFVTRDGSPYSRLARDQSGMTAIDWGVSGVPESFLILPGGHIAWHGAAALDEGVFEREIRPLAGGR